MPDGGRTLRHPDDLSAFVDGSATIARRETIAAHLAVCPQCLTDVRELRAARDLLASAPSAWAPDELTQRLVAVAGDEVGHPLWLRSRSGTDLPSARARRRHRLVAAGSGLVASVVGVVALGVALDPDLPALNDVAATAAQRFDQTTLWGSAGEAIGVVLDTGTAATTATGVPSASPNVAGVTLDSSTATGLLLTAAIPDVRYEGVVHVNMRQSTGWATAIVKVEQNQASTATLTVLGAASTPVAIEQVSLSSVFAVTSAADARYELIGTSVVAGMPVIGIEAKRTDGSVAERWWLSPRFGLVLAAESFAPSGELTRVARFTSLSVEPGSPADTRAPSASTASCPTEFNCPTALAGLPLRTVRVDAGSGSDVLIALYTDGSSSVSLTEQRGQLKGTESNSDGDLMTVAWQSGGVVLAVTSNQRSRLDAAISQLPHVAPVGRSVLSRAEGGLLKLGRGHS